MGTVIGTWTSGNYNENYTRLFMSCQILPSIVGVLLVYCGSHNEFKISLKPDEPGFPVEVPLR